jgi:competence protein ComEC
MAGLILGLFWRLPATLILGITFLFIPSGIYFLIRKSRGFANILFFLGILFTGTLFINHYLYPDLPENHVFYWANNLPLKVEGFIYRSPELFPDKTRLYVKSQYIWTFQKKFPVTGNILLTIEGSRKKLLVGDRIIFFARLRKPRNFKNPGGFNYVRWLAFREIYVVAHLSTDQNLCRIGIQRSAFSFSLRKIDLFRNRVREMVDNTPSPAKYFLRAVILGERKVVPENLGENFSRSGTAHILAISGLHIGIVATFSYFLLRCILSLSEYLLLVTNVHKLSAFLSLLPILFYTLIAGASVSAQRAFIMVATYISALIFNRERDLYHTLALAALVILIMQPASLFGLSFQLSFVSVLGILFFSPRLLSLFPKEEILLKNLENPIGREMKHKLILFILVSFSALLATGPLVVYHFNLLSFSGLIANLIIVPLVGFFVVPPGLLGVVFTPLFPHLASFLFSLAAVFSNVVIIVTNFFANLSWSNFMVPTPTIVEVAIFYLFLLSLFWWKFSNLPKKILFLSFILLITNNLYWHFHFKPRGLQVVFIDVGQGDAALIRFPEGKTMLIDGGGFYNHGFDTGKNIIAPLLLKKRICRLDYLVLTHPHPDHFDGLRFIARNFSVREFWTNGDSFKDPYFDQLQKILKQKGIRVRTLNSNLPPQFIQGVRIDFLHPPPHYFPTHHNLNTFLNNRSLVIKFSYGKVQFLFTGDIHVEAEKSILLSRKDVSALVLKVPHHGSLTSSSIPFLGAVKPHIAICSVGYQNPFKLPRRRILQRFLEQGCMVYRTDLDGGVVITTNGKEVDIRCNHARSEKGRVFKCVVVN